jgi:multidrug efflux pump subunit AcrA (membrane-fusion protein)
MAASFFNTTRGFRLVNAALLLLAGSAVVAGACSFSNTPAVDSATLWTDTVKHGDLAIERRGAGQILDTESGELYAQLRIPESQSLDLEIGQPATLDLRVAEVPARVVELGDRIVQGVRLVRLEFTEGAPEQALPGMSIDGTIEVGTIADTLYVGKPAYGQSNARIGIFKLVDGGRYAERVEVQTGRSSVNLIEILSGLEEGDQIILSDMSRFDAAGRLALR